MGNGKEDNEKEDNKRIPRHAGGQKEDKPLEVDSPVGPGLNGKTGGKHAR